MDLWGQEVLEVPAFRVDGELPFVPIVPYGFPRAPHTHRLSRQPPGPNLSIIALEKEGILNR